MPSQEVMDANGAAPDKTKKSTAANLLTVKRAALQESRERYATAKAMRAEDEMSEESRRIDSLRAIVDELEHDAQAELEQNGAQAATAWMKEYAARRTVAVAKIEAAQAAALKKLDALIAAIDHEACLRAEVGRDAFPAEVLSMRFDLSSLAPAQQPVLKDWATPVITATDKMRPSMRQRKSLVVSAQACDTPDTLRQKRLAAALEYVGHNAEMVAKGKRKKGDEPLPREVWTILSEAPGKAELTQASVQSRDTVSAIQRALNSVPGPLGISSI
jgi:hypothetical protein